jgi:hypothetical protein
MHLCCVFVVCMLYVFAHMRVSSYSKADAAEQRTKVYEGRPYEGRPASAPGPRWFLPNASSITVKHLVLVIYRQYCKAWYHAGTGTPRDAGASGSLLVLPRAAAGTRGQHSKPHYTCTGGRCAG